MYGAGWHFFFSSRRRHTRSDRDWSSDVCSSDLVRDPQLPAPQTRGAVDALLRQPRRGGGRDPVRSGEGSGGKESRSRGVLEDSKKNRNSAVSDKLLDLVGLGGKSAADKGKDTSD